MSIISPDDELAIKKVEELEQLRQQCFDSGKRVQAQVYTKQIEDLLELLRTHGVILVPPQPSSAHASDRTTPAGDYTAPNAKPQPSKQGPEVGNPQQGKRVQFRMSQIKR